MRTPKRPASFDIEDEELVPRLHPLFDRREGKHLAIAADDLGFGIDDRGGVANAAVTPLVHGAVDQPDAVMAGNGLKVFFRRAGQRLGMLQKRPVDGEFREQHHLHPGVQMHGQIDAMAHGVEIRAMAEMHLDTGDCKWRHDHLSFLSGKILA